MESIKTKISKEETQVTHENSPDVVAYRVGKLEESQKTGFAELNQKLDQYLANFVTKGEFETVIMAIREDIQEAKAPGLEAKTTIDTFKNKVVGYVLTGFALMLLALYGLEKFIK